MCPKSVKAIGNLKNPNKMNLRSVSDTWEYLKNTVVFPSTTSIPVEY